MTNEELLKPRYIVINDYPNSIFDIGEILDEEYVGKSSFNELKNFPHIFKPLEWWEELNLEDLPKYLKTDVYGKNLFRKVEEYFYEPLNNVDLCFKAYYVGELRTYLMEIFLPSTEEEYLEYIKNLEK